MAALGLICVFASGSCWAQQSTSSTNHTAKTHAKAAAKPAAKAKSEPAPKTSTKSAKAGKGESSKNKQQVAAKDDKSRAADKPAPAAASAKPDTKVADLKSDVKSDAKVDAKPDVRAEAAPPPGTMMGAYGQSLMRAPAAATATTVAAAGTAAALAAAQPAAQPATAGTPSTNLPATAMMGAAAGNAGDSVARFLQSRGIVAQAQGATPQTDAQANASTNPGLLNQVRDKASDLVLSAMNFLGVPYKRGGNSVSNGFDCSGFTRHIFEMSVGLVLPRRADEQAKMSSLVPIRKEDLKPGDLVFFNTMRQTFSHVGIYVGEGKFIHSPRVGGAVRVEDMREAYWAKRFTGARRADLNQANPG